MLFPIFAMALALQAQQPAALSGLRFVPTTSCRLVNLPVAKGQTRVVNIRATGCPAPPAARAYSLRVTATPDTAALGYLTVFPAGRPRPASSTLNSWDGRIVTNAAIVEAGVDGNISVYADDAAFVELEINGHFLPREAPGGGLAFYSLPPCRLADTRGMPRVAVVGPIEHTIAVRDVCEVPADAVAYSVNLTAVPENPHLLETTLYPSGFTRPNTASLITIDRRVVASAAIVQGGVDGKVSVYGTQGHDVVLDINGYFAPPGQFNALMYHPVAPCRVADTRPDAPLGAASARVFTVRGNCDIPNNARAVAFNITAVPLGPLGYVTFWPAFFPQPLVSTLNAFRGEVVANLAIVPVGLNGAVAGYASDAAHLVIDTAGYFTPDRPPVGSN